MEYREHDLWRVSDQCRRELIWGKGGKSEGEGEGGGVFKRNVHFSMTMTCGMNRPDRLGGWIG